ncbi:MAG: uridine diphosphate-N-acetylglucosamine-binding protein YvcK [Jiangellales bacterium]
MSSDALPGRGHPAGPAVVALGGGHGLAASLSSLRRLTDDLTAVVTVADNGGSSGRIRDQYDVLPPGDLRMALAALCGDDDWGQTWAQVLQHRFAGDGDLCGHALGNLLIAAVWQRLGDPVAGLDLVGALLRSHGRVLPMSTEPLSLRALVAAGAHEPPREVVGQVQVATTPGNVVDVSLVPNDPPACPDAVKAVLDADLVVLGPGSWFSSVIPHLLVPELAQAVSTTSATRLVLLNLRSATPETEQYAPHDLLDVLGQYAPGLGVDVVLADDASVLDRRALAASAARLGAELELAPLAADDAGDRHDPERLTRALATLGGRGRMPVWR